MPGRSLPSCSSISNWPRRSAAVPLTKYFWTRPCAVPTSVADRVVAAGYRYFVVAENIAKPSYEAFEAALGLE